MAAIILEHPTFKKHKECQIRFKESLDYVIDKEKTKAFNILKDEFDIIPKSTYLDNIEPKVKAILSKMKTVFECPHNYKTVFSLHLDDRRQIPWFTPEDEYSLSMQEIIYVAQYCLMMGQQELMES